MKDTFIIRSEWWPAISKLNDTQKAIILSNLFKFHADDNVDLSDPLVELVWSFIEPNLIRNMTNYEERVKKASENGKKGGRPKTEENQTKGLGFSKTEENPKKGLAFSETNKKPIETLNVSVSVSDNVSVSENDSVSDKIGTPAREDFLLFCKGLDIDFDKLQDTIAAKYDTWVRAGWRNGFGKPITDWQQTIINTIPHLKPMPKKKQAPSDVKTTLNFGKR
jgi:hypothetical protein